MHDRLPDVVARHRRHSWRQPFHAPTVRAFEQLQDMDLPLHRSLILDSGCGTGESTRLIARAFPQALVIGVDKSASRLQRAGIEDEPLREENAVWLRGELTTFWRLALRAEWRLQRHYLLYPNPWPKPAHLQRRWHGHPVFPSLLALGGIIEMRCNWKIYAEEFAWACSQMLGKEVAVQLMDGSTAPSSISSPFEAKYRASGHELYCVEVDGAV